MGLFNLIKQYLLRVIRRNSMAEELFLGEHYILELSNCCPDALNDPTKI